MDTVRLNIFPEDWFNVPSTNNISWEINGNEFKFIFLIQDQYIELYFSEPEELSISDNSSERGLKTTSVRNAYIIYNNRRINGVLFHEYIRSNNNTPRKQEPVKPNRFGEFTWVPLVSNDNVFLFITRNTSQTLLHWRKEENQYIFTNSRNTYNYEVTSREYENISKRNNIPIEWELYINELNININLKGEAHHTGYGDLNSELPPLYRQQLVVGNLIYKNTATPIFGMAEIIIDNE